MRGALENDLHFAIFGLTISSSWGNGHATLWRSLVKAILQRGHRVTFFEHDVPYYANERDLDTLPAGGTLRLYQDLAAIEPEARRILDSADVAICTSFCPDGPTACDWILRSQARIKAFYDLDTPVTLDALETGSEVAYLPAEGLGAFDLVLSYTGGLALDELRSRLGARFVAPLYGSVDPESHHPVASLEEYRADLSYLGTYAADRQERLAKLFLEPAARMPNAAFLIGGAQYPESFPWAANISFKRHVPPPRHPAFFCSSRATLNITRAAMARYGFCPSGRLFEAAACGVPLLSDAWEGLDSFFQPGREILQVSTADDVIEALSLSDHELHAIASAARERTLAEHTGECRVRELESICAAIFQPATQTAVEVAV